MAVRRTQEEIQREELRKNMNWALLAVRQGRTPNASEQLIKAMGGPDKADEFINMLICKATIGDITLFEEVRDEMDRREAKRAEKFASRGVTS